MEKSYNIKNHLNFHNLKVFKKCSTYFSVSELKIEFKSPSKKNKTISVMSEVHQYYFLQLPNF